MGVSSLKDLAEEFHCQVIGDPNTVVNAVATLQAAHTGAISFLANTKYKKFLSITEATAVIIKPEMVSECKTQALVCADPYTTYAKIAAKLFPNQIPSYGVHPNAVISESAKIDPSATIGPNSYIGDNVEIGAGVNIGANCVLEANSKVAQGAYFVANVTLCCDTVIGQRALIHPGVVIGADGFGIAMDQGRWIKVPQLGCVQIGDDVEIGANTTIDRGAIENTVIEDGVKIDNQVQVAHNVRIGAHTAIAGCSAIAGSTTIGKYCTIAGAVGIVGHLNIADRVHVTAMSLVTKSINKAGSYSSGTPMLETKQWHKSAVRFKQLDKLAKQLSEMKKYFQGLKP